MQQNTDPGVNSPAADLSLFTPHPTLLQATLMLIFNKVNKIATSEKIIISEVTVCFQCARMHGQKMVDKSF